MTDHDKRRAKKGSSENRVPPHSLEAEDAALGAALLDVGAVDHLIEHLEPGDFYSPANVATFHALRTVRTVNGSVDVITVADQMRQDGTLEEHGGIERLNALQNMTPSVSGIASYSRIVHDASKLRRLLLAGAQITDLAYAGTEDPSGAIHQAQTYLEELRATAGSDAVTSIDVADVSALLETDLEPEQPTYLTRTDGQALFYAGKTHTLQAEPSSGKSWISLAAVVEVLELGGEAGYYDFEDTPSGILRRARQLGAPEEALRDRFHYARPLGRLGPAELAHIDRTLEEWNFDLFVIDGVGESMTRNGMSEDKAEDVLAWFDLLPRRIAESGAAVVMVDHVSKDPEQRGRWARGSSAKLGAVDGAAYQIKLSESFSRHKAGAVRLVVAKDRPGGVGAIGETVAVAKINPSGGGERVKVTFEPKAEQKPGEVSMPTNVMTEISRVLEQHPNGLTRAQLDAYVPNARRETKKNALVFLMTDGFVAEQRAGKSRTLVSVRPFRGETFRTEAVEMPPPATEYETEPLFDLPVDPPDDQYDEHRASMDYLAYTDPDNT